ncbi:MAG: GNAT family N-acetyltransferase, partial [Candidatus Omnitrophota bacterium]
MFYWYIKNSAVLTRDIWLKIDNPESVKEKVNQARESIETEYSRTLRHRRYWLVALGVSILGILSMIFSSYIVESRFLIGNLLTNPASSPLGMGLLMEGLGDLGRAAFGFLMAYGAVFAVHEILHIIVAAKLGLDWQVRIITGCRQDEDYIIRLVSLQEVFQRFDFQVYLGENPDRYKETMSRLAGFTVDCVFLAAAIGVFFFSNLALACRVGWFLVPAVINVLTDFSLRDAENRELCADGIFLLRYGKFRKDKPTDASTKGAAAAGSPAELRPNQTDNVSRPAKQDNKSPAQLLHADKLPLVKKFKARIVITDSIQEIAAYRRLLSLTRVEGVKMSRYFEDRAETVVVLDEEGRVIGGAQFNIEFGQNGRWLFIVNLAIEKPYRRQGVGSKILAELERIATKEGVVRIYATPFRRASGFYEQNKFWVSESLTLAEKWFTSSPAESANKDLVSSIEHLGYSSSPVGEGLFEGSQKAAPPPGKSLLQRLQEVVSSDAVVKELSLTEIKEGYQSYRSGSYIYLLPVDEVPTQEDLDNILLTITERDLVVINDRGQLRFILFYLYRKWFRDEVLSKLELPIVLYFHVHGGVSNCAAISLYPKSEDFKWAQELAPAPVYLVVEDMDTGQYWHWKIDKQGGALFNSGADLIYMAWHSSEQKPFVTRSSSFGYGTQHENVRTMDAILREDILPLLGSQDVERILITFKDGARMVFDRGSNPGDTYLYSPTVPASSPISKEIVERQIASSLQAIFEASLEWVEFIGKQAQAEMSEKDIASLEECWRCYAQAINLLGLLGNSNLEEPAAWAFEATASNRVKGWALSALVRTKPEQAADLAFGWYNDLESTLQLAEANFLVTHHRTIDFSMTDIFVFDSEEERNDTSDLAGIIAWRNFALMILAKAQDRRIFPLINQMLSSGKPREIAFATRLIQETDAADLKQKLMGLPTDLLNRLPGSINPKLFFMLMSEFTILKAKVVLGDRKTIDTLKQQLKILTNSNNSFYFTISLSIAEILLEAGERELVLDKFGGLYPTLCSYIETQSSGQLTNLLLGGPSLQYILLLAKAGHKEVHRLLEKLWCKAIGSEEEDVLLELLLPLVGKMKLVAAAPYIKKLLEKCPRGEQGDPAKCALCKTKLAETLVKLGDPAGIDRLLVRLQAVLSNKSAADFFAGADLRMQAAAALLEIFLGRKDFLSQTMSTVASSPAGKKSTSTAWQASYSLSRNGMRVGAYGNFNESSPPVVLDRRLHPFGNLSGKILLAALLAKTSRDLFNNKEPALPPEFYLYLAWSYFASAIRAVAILMSTHLITPSSLSSIYPHRHLRDVDGNNAYPPLRQDSADYMDRPLIGVDAITQLFNIHGGIIIKFRKFVDKNFAVVRSNLPAGKSKIVTVIFYALGGLGRMVPTVSSPTVGGREQVL